MFWLLAGVLVGIAIDIVMTALSPLPIFYELIFVALAVLLALAWIIFVHNAISNYEKDPFMDRENYK